MKNTLSTTFILFAITIGFCSHYSMGNDGFKPNRLLIQGKVKNIAGSRIEIVTTEGPIYVLRKSILIQKNIRPGKKSKLIVNLINYIFPDKKE